MNLDELDGIDLGGDGIDVGPEEDKEEEQEQQQTKTQAQYKLDKIQSAHHTWVNDATVPLFSFDRECDFTTSDISENGVKRANVKRAMFTAAGREKVVKILSLPSVDGCAKAQKTFQAIKRGLQNTTPATS